MFKIYVTKFAKRKTDWVKNFDNKLAQKIKKLLKQKSTS